MSSFPFPEGVDLDALVREWTPEAEAGDAWAVSALCTVYLIKQDWEAAEPWARRLLDGRLRARADWQRVNQRFDRQARVRPIM